MAHLKNNSLRIIYVEDEGILPGAVSTTDFEPEVMEYSGVKALMGTGELMEGQPPKAKAESPPPPKPESKPAHQK